MDVQSAAHIGRPLAHAEQSKTTLLFAPGRRVFRVEADAVVVDHQLHEVVFHRQIHFHMPGAGVQRHIFQGFLKDAVKRQLDVAGQPHGQRHAGQLEDTPVRS